MTEQRALWLIVNDASGSNDAAAVSAVEAAFAQAGLTISRTIRFPSNELPTPSTLDQAGVAMLAVFAGDGTINAAIERFADWGGAILPLPGGTMNLLSKRLHGDVAAAEIIGRLGKGGGRAIRPNVARSSQGIALAGLLAGPGTSWAPVREAMRDGDVPGMIETAGDAISHTSDGPPLHLIKPAVGRENGYPLLEITPTESGLHVAGYYAETVGDLLRQGAALVRRSFRDGPHDDLGTFDRFTVSMVGGEPMGLLLDGEPAVGEREETFELAQCTIDLLATVDAD